MMTNSYDVIIVGLGAMGAASAWQCANRGMKVLGLEQYEQGHKLGSSHGTSRAIREAYFEAPDYVPLVQRSYELWESLEKESEQSLMKLAGALYFAQQGHKILQGVERAAKEHNLPYEVLTSAHVAERFPGFQIDDDWLAFYETRGGIIQSDLCQELQLKLAREKGADIRHKIAVKSWKSNNGKVTVETDQGKFVCNHLVLTLGPWACNQLADLNLPIHGKKVTMVTFKAKKPDFYRSDDFSVYFWATPEGVFAGFPEVDGEGIKVCRHDLNNTCTPETIDRTVDQSIVEEISNFTDKHLPYANDGIVDAFTCMYTMTPDNHFIIDQTEPDSKISYATGFSGHGFKFAPVVGEIMADFAENGKTDHPIGFLRASRF